MIEFIDIQIRLNPPLDDQDVFKLDYFGGASLSKNGHVSHLVCLSVCMSESLSVTLLLNLLKVHLVLPNIGRYSLVKSNIVHYGLV